MADEFPLDAQEVIDYSEDTYTGRLRPGGHRRAPLFDLALWNMYDQTIGDLPRTNNAVEGWHRRFQANVGAYHPNFWKFMDILKREQSLNHVNISQARTGHQPELQRRRYQDSNRRIKNIVKTTTTGTDCSISVASPTTSVCEETVFLKTTKLPALCHPKRFF